MSAPAAAQMPEFLRTALHAAAIPASAVSFSVVRMTDGTRVLALDDSTPRVTASTMKLLTTLAGLELLGPTFRATTTLRIEGTQTGDVLNGSVWIVGGGSGDYDLDALRTQLRALRANGVRDIRGDIGLDRSYFQPTRSDLGVPAFDEAPEFRYNFIPDAISLNANLVNVRLSASANTVTLRTEPPLERTTIVASLALNDLACKDWEDTWQTPETTAEKAGAFVIRLRGAFPRNCDAVAAVSLVDRDVYIERVVRALWAELGGAWSGVAREGVVPANAREVALHQSRTLAETVREINKSSDNPKARLLYLQLGRQRTANAALTTTAARAEVAVRDWLRTHGIDDAGIVLENGSGLSRIEKMSAMQLTQLLRVGAKSFVAPEFISSLPIAGIDGTLRRRFADGAARNQARLKTGTLRDVVALAGYVPDANGEAHAMAILINHPRATYAVARPIVDAFASWIAASDLRGAALADALMKQIPAPNPAAQQ